MNRRALACLAAAVALHASAARAESLRCHGSSVYEGDSQLSVLYKCGQPLLKASYCAPVYYPYSLQPIPVPYAGALVPCQMIEEWLYDRGPGNLMAIVRLRSGAVQSIVYGRDPR